MCWKQTAVLSSVVHFQCPDPAVLGRNELGGLQGQRMKQPVLKERSNLKPTALLEIEEEKLRIPNHHQLSQ